MPGPEPDVETLESRLQRFVRDGYGPIVAGLTLISGSRAAAEDAVQEALARALARGIDDLHSLEAWIVRVAINLVRSDFRRLRAELRARRASSEGADASRPQERIDTAVHIAGILRRLPRRQREVLVLRYYLDMSVGESATALGIKEGTVKALLHRARGAVAAALEHEGSEDREVSGDGGREPDRTRAEAGH